MIGKGPSARSLTIDLPPFTLIAATTRENLLSHPLRSRFGGIFRLEYYEPKDIRSIIERSAKIFNIEVTAPAVEILAKASRATPRVANRLLKRARDFAAVKNKPAIDEETARATLELLDIDEAGLEPHDRRILEVIIEKFGGGPVGVNSIAAALSEERGVFEDIYEPYLMTLGFLQRTPSGRIVLPAAYEHLGIKRKGELL
jgi:Holliday junction DNA helicase RuvB